MLVTNGGKHAVFTAFAALCDPGDEVICPAPYWTTYPEAITLAGGTPVVIETADETGFKVTVEQLEAARTERTKVLLFVSPDNPSGSVYTPAEVAAIGQWAVERGVWVVTDEIYEHLTYGPHEFSSMPTLVPDIAEQCIVVNGVAKTYAMTGWRVGWMIGPDDVIKAANNFQSHATSNVANVAQRAALAAVSGGLDDVAMMRAAFERRGSIMHKMLSEIPGVTCIEPQGAFYCFPNVCGLLGRPLGGVTAETTLELADLVLDQIKVAFVPGEAFGAPGYAAFVRARRRRPRRRHHPPRRPRRRLTSPQPPFCLLHPTPGRGLKQTVRWLGPESGAPPEGVARGEGGHDDEDEALGDLFDGAQHVAGDAADLAHRERADRRRRRRPRRRRAARPTSRSRSSRSRRHSGRRGTRRWRDNPDA